MADRLELEARFNDHASAGVKKLGRTLEAVRPSNGMEQAQKWMGTFRTAADKANVAVRPMTSTLTALGVGGLAASMSMSELVRSIKGLSDGALNTRELARQSRISVGDLQRLQYVATKFHMDPAAVDGVLAGWSDKMLDFKRHTGDFYNELMRQNQDVAARIQADSPVEALKDTLTFLSRIKDPALQRRWAESMNLGGLVPMLGKGPDGLAAAFADAGREVKPISQAMIDAADRLNDSTARMTQSWTNLKNDIGPSVIDPVAHMVDRLDEVLKATAASPADAAAGAAIIAGSLAAFWLRARIMRGSKLAGAAAEGAELSGAAREQVKAGGSLIEAARELQIAARELQARGGTPGPAVPGEPGKPAAPEVVKEVPKGGILGKGGFKGAASGLAEGIIGALVYDYGEKAMDWALGWKPDNQATLDRATSLSNVYKDVKDQWFGGRLQDGRVKDDAYPSPQAATSTLSPESYWARKRAYLGLPAASDKWKAPSAYDREARARNLGPTYDAPNTDGNALHRWEEMPVAGAADTASASDKWQHPDDDRLSRARPDDLKRDIQEGAKAGIIAGLREMAQQQELDGGGPSANVGGGRMLGRGAANMRYGRQGGAGAGAYKGTPVPDAPYNGKNIEGLSPAASKQYAAILGNRESGNRYGTTNPYGYAGRWQFGASALAENGYVRPGTTNAGLRDPHNWTGKGGVASMGDWLGNKGGVQDQALGEYTNRHYAQLKAAGVIRDGMSPSEIAGWLAAAHLKGVGGAIALSRGRDNVDANGTSASSYRRMMQGVGATPPATPALPGAGTPKPAVAAVTDAEVFAARQRLIAGGHDPKDIALRDRYLKEQNTPKPAAAQGHRAGGQIRGPGTGTSDSIPAMLSHGEFVVNAKASGQWGALLHAINGGLPRFADGGPVGFGVDKRFYPKFTPAILPEEGKRNRQSWLNFFQRPGKDGGMGASRSVALGSTAMMNGETGWNLNSNSYGWDVNGPSGGAAQWHDVTTGRWAGKLHRLSDLMTFAMQQHADWHDTTVQQAFWKREATSSLSGAWHAMRLARMAAGTLREGINRFENPADHDGEMRRRMPNIAKLAREDAGGGQPRVAQEMDPLEVNIRHHPHTGHPIVTAKAGKGVKLAIRTAPMMRPT